MQGYNDGLTSQPQRDEYAEPRLSPELAAKEEFEAFEREEVTKQIFEEGLGLAGVALLKQVCFVPSHDWPGVSLMSRQSMTWRVPECAWVISAQLAHNVGPERLAAHAAGG